MEYLSRDELVRLFKVARSRNPLHHVAPLVGLLHGLRVSETLAVRGRDICDGRLSVKRLKKSRPTPPSSISEKRHEDHPLRSDKDHLVPSPVPRFPAPAGTSKLETSWDPQVSKPPAY